MSKLPHERFGNHLTYELDNIVTGRPSRLDFSEFLRRESTDPNSPKRKPLSPTLWANWRSGKVLPREEYRQSLAKYIASHTSEDFTAVLARLNEAARPDFDSNTLRIGRIDHPPYCSITDPPTGLLDGMFFRYAKLDRRSVRWVIHEARPRYTGEQDAIQALVDQTADVAIGFYDTIPRSPRIHCFHSSLRTTFNATVRVDSPEHLLALKHLQSAFVNPKLAADLLGDYRVLVLQNGIAKQYLEVIDFPMSLLQTVSSMQVEAYEERLSSDRKLIAFGDELTMLHLMARLNRREVSTCLLFPLTTRRSAQNSEYKRQLPGFIVGLASVSRANEALVDELERCLRLMLETDRYTISSVLEEAYLKTVELIRTELGTLPGWIRQDWFRHIQAESAEDPEKIDLALAHRATRYLMRLTSDDHTDGLLDLNLPWRQIVSLVRRKLGPMPEGTREPSENGFSLEYRPFSFFVKAPETSSPGELVPLASLGLLGELLSSMQAVVSSPRKIDRLEKDQGFESAADVRIGTLRSFERMKDWRYFGLPFRVPYDVLFLRGHFEMDKVLEVLGEGQFPAGARAIVLKNGSVRELLRYQICIDPAMISEVDRLDPKGFIDQLADVRSKPGIILLDALSCMNILGTPQLDVISIFSGASVEVMKEWLGKAPSLHVGIAVNRTRARWVEFFSDAFPVLAAESQHFLLRLLKRHYLGLRESLVSKGYSEAAATLLADNIFHLDGNIDAEFQEWKEVLQKLQGTLRR
jgi:hypothetical protein